MVKPTEMLRHLSASRESETGPRTVTIVRAIREHTSATAIATALDISRRQVYRAVDPLVEAGLIEQDDGFEMTAAGARLLAAFEAAEGTIGAQGLAYLAESEHRLALLAALSERPRSKRALADAESMPSRTTINRAITAFVREGWVREDTDGKVNVTELGESVRAQFSTLLVAADQAIAKAPLLRELDPELELPLHVLEGTELVTETGERPFALLEASIEAADLRGVGVDRIRSVVPFFSPVMFGEFESLVTRETTFEVIYTPRAYRQLTRPRYVRYLATFLLASSVDVRIYPEPVTWGLGIYDETVMLAGSTESAEQAAVVGTTDSLTEWATATFETLWEQSETPPERFKRWLGRTVRQ